MSHGIRKGLDVMYKDPISKEACAAKVTKVLPLSEADRNPPAGRPARPKVYLVFWQEEGPQSHSKGKSDAGVPYGPGEMGHYWLPGEAAGDV